MSKKREIKLPAGTGWIPDLEDQRDFVYGDHFRKLRARPAKVSWRHEMTPVESQGSLGSCVGNALVAEGERQLFRMGLKRHGSRLGLYYDARKVRGWQNYDSGCAIRDGIKVLAGKGMGDESVWPYLISKFKTPPPAPYYRDSYRFRIEKYYACNSLQSILDAIAKGYTVSFGMTLYQSFLRPKAGGFIPMPGASESPRGGHAMQIIGYDDSKTNKFGRPVVEVRNSWGSWWGDKGHCWIPFELIEAKARDCWVYEFIDDGK